MMNILSAIFLLVGGFFYTIGGLGVYRMPDVYNRAQAGTKATTLGTISTFIGVAALKPEWALKLFLIMIFIVITNPASSSTLLRAAYLKGVKPCANTTVDDLEQVYRKERQ